MIEVAVKHEFESWREAARTLLSQQVAPEAVLWHNVNDQQHSLSGMCETGDIAVADAAGGINRVKVPREFIALAKSVSYHRNANRWPILYRVLWRLLHGEPDLLHITVDDDVHALVQMEKAVRRDVHKMKAFVRFRRIEKEDGEEFVAWHRPDHRIVRVTAPWFARRFAIMRWTILTPLESAAWDTHELLYGSGVPVSAAPLQDDLEDLWKTYYRSIFNPARVKVKAMKAEMPVRHWATLPEAQEIDELLRKAPERVQLMVRKSEKESVHSAAAGERATAVSAADFLPARLELPVLKAAAAKCQGCDLYCHATQVVFGIGPETAGVMFIGEQPGDKEDLAGKPFIGPSGQMLDQALKEVGIDRSEVYVTNAVKHFKFEQRGIRRIHSKPNAREMSACRPWLEAEIAAVRPKLIVCLGATAAQTLMGREFRITRDRGQIFSETEWAPALVATNHPSAILRTPDAAAREEAYRHFVADLKIVHGQMAKITRAVADASAGRIDLPQKRPPTGHPSKTNSPRPAPAKTGDPSTLFG